VGQVVVQRAVKKVCTVYAVASGENKMEQLRKLGAQHVIDRTKGDYAQQVGALMKDARIDVSFNAVGGTTFKKDMELLGSGGAQVLFGGSERGEGAGMLGTLKFVWNMGLVIPIFLMMKSKSLIGVNMLRISEHQPQLMAECVAGVVGAHAEGWLKPHVHKEYTREQLPDALEALGGGGTMGKVVVRW